MTENRTFAALILAAGYSSRMGAFKPLLPLGSSFMLEMAINRFRLAGIEDISVVTGYKAEEITPVLDRLGVKAILNAKYHKGMFSSIRAGVAGLEPRTEAFFLLPVDIPLIRPETITALGQAYRTHGPGLVYPCFEGARGHPPLISRACVADLPPDQAGGLRAFLTRFEAQALNLDVVDEFILKDCDTPEAYHRLQIRALKEDIPTERECLALWAKYDVPENVIAHSRTVAHMAKALAVQLNRVGFALDTDLITAAGYLHDLAKGRPDHALVGAGILERMGYPRVSRIVAVHMDFRQKDWSLEESALIYLADKCVDGDRMVTLKERFGKLHSRLAGRPDILKAAARRLEWAQIIKDRLEEILGVTMEDILHRVERNTGGHDYPAGFHRRAESDLSDQARSHPAPGERPTLYRTNRFTLERSGGATG
ncbi:MAG: NTP transferase domain-containing protein [Deltaproteobacteria bacterium]|nr:NTP transferase domain-containing protein [Deltaproteobacteria bacterium]